jgi:inosose dehydratase
VSVELTRKEFLTGLAGVTVAASTDSAFQVAAPARQPTASGLEKNIRWAYMDHWSVITPRGRTSPYLSVKYMDRYIRQLAVLGFTGFDTFNFRLGLLAGMFGSLKGFENFLKDHGFEKFTGVFAAYPDTGKARAIHDRANHDAIFAECESAMKACEGLSVENFVVMPANTYWQTEPVTDEKIKIMADLWNRVGRMTLEQHGVKTSCHHEFWCAIRTPDEIVKFYQWTDPRYVHYWCDTAQTVIAGQDPTDLYNQYHDRTAGFHFKDTHNVDTKREYRLPPDPELIAPSVKRWFWEMGTPEGKVDFPRLMTALKQYSYRGWITVEHDKVDVDNGSFAESTCIARWYIDNVLSKIYA